MPADLRLRGAAAVLTVVFAVLLLRATLAGQGEVVLGMSAAFTGASAQLGLELYRGSMAYLEHVNATGGMNGVRVRIKAYDDAYDPNKAIMNSIRLIEQDRVFLLFNYVGTPTVTRVLPVLTRFSSQHGSE